MTFFGYLFDMKKKYIITESQLRLLESGGAELLIIGCLYGGFYALISLLEGAAKNAKNKEKEKEDMKRLEKIKSSEDFIIQMIQKNNNKNFSVEICELKDKSVNFVKLLQGFPDFQYQIKEAKFICDVYENSAQTYLKLKGNRVGEEYNQIIELRVSSFGGGLEWTLIRDKSIYNLKLENNKLKNYITEELKFPIMFFWFNPKTKVETDF
jgi:hypothetical protein